MLQFLLEILANLLPPVRTRTLPPVLPSVLPRKERTQEEIKSMVARHRFNKHYLELKVIGEGFASVVILCVPETAVEVFTEVLTRLGNRDWEYTFKTTAWQALRESICVVKHFQPVLGIANCSHKIAALTAISKSRHVLQRFYSVREKNGEEGWVTTPYVLKNPPHFMSRLCSIRDADSQDDMWYTMPYISGGTLQHFQEQMGNSIGVSFIYHVIIQTLQGLTMLHKRNIVHGMLHGTSIMIDPSQTEFKSYPNILITDFKCAELVSLKTHKSGEFEHRKRKDIYDAGEMWHAWAHKTKSVRRDDGRCSCNIHDDGLAPFGCSPVFWWLMTKTSKSTIMEGLVTCDSLSKDFLPAMEDRRLIYFEELPRAAWDLLAQGIPSDVEVSEAILEDLKATM